MMINARKTASEATSTGVVTAALSNLCLMEGRN